MQKPLPMLNASVHEFSYIASLAIKASSHCKALEFHLNAVTERLNETVEELGDRDNSLRDFKDSFLGEIIALLDDNSSADESVNSVVNDEMADYLMLLSQLKARIDELNRKACDAVDRLDRLEDRITVLEKSRGDDSKTDLFDLLG